MRYRYEYRYGIWASDMGDDSIDTVISHIDMGHLLNVLVLLHFSALPEPLSSLTYDKVRRSVTSKANQSKA